MVIRLKHILIVGWMIILSLITYGLWWWHKLAPDVFLWCATVVGILLGIFAAIASILGIIGLGFFTYDALRGNRAVLNSEVTTIRLAKPKNRNEVSPDTEIVPTEVKKR